MMCCDNIKDLVHKAYADAAQKRFGDTDNEVLEKVVERLKSSSNTPTQEEVMVEIVELYKDLILDTVIQVLSELAPVEGK